MRWPFWRRAAPAPVPPRGPVVPLTTVSDRHRPTVTGFGLPDVAGTRSLLVRPPIVPGPTTPRGRLYGTVVARHIGPVARRGRLPSLRHLFTGLVAQLPADTPQPWAVRVIDRPPEPTSFDPSADAGRPERVPEHASFDPSTGIGWPEPHPAPEPAPFDPSADAGWPHHVPESANIGWPEPHQVPQSAPFDPFGSPAPSDEDWITSDAIADLQAVLTAARGAPAPSHRTAPVPPPAAQPIRRLTLAESRRRGITSAQPAPADDNSPSPIVEAPASDPDLATVDEPTVPPDPVAPTTTIDPEPPTPEQADAPPARARVTRLVGRPSPNWSPAVDPVPTSGAEQSPSGPDRSVSTADAERAGRGPERSVRSGRGAVTPQRSVPAPGVERGRRSSVPERSGRGSSAPERSASTSGVESSEPERSVSSTAGRAPEPMTGRGSPDGPVSSSGAEQSVTGLGPLAPGRSASMSDAERSMTGRGSSVRERPSAERLIAGRDSSVPERSVAGDSPMPVGKRDQPTPAGDVPTTVRMLAGHDQPAPAGGPWSDRSASGRDRPAPEWPAVPMPGLNQPDLPMPGANQPDLPTPGANEPDSPMPGVDQSNPPENAGPEAIPTSHPLLSPRAEPRKMPDFAFDTPRLGLGRPLPPGATRLVAPPADLAAAIQTSYGVDVSATPIHRGPTATARAATLSARAFTERGEVFLPDQLGPLTTPTARGALAHELTHVAQQRILGAELPAEWTPAGQALEQHAVAAERHVRTGQQMTPPPILGPPEMSTADSIQRQPEHDVPLLSWTAPTPPDEPPEPPDELAGYADRLVALCGQRLANLDDSTDLDELAERIYHRLRDMLRGELLVDRERAGLLTDFR